MRKLILVLACVGLAVATQAQLSQKHAAALLSQDLFAVNQDDAAPVDTSWKKGGTFSLNFGQTYLDQWAGGGQSSLAIGGLVNLFANYAKGDDTWDNTLDVAYGLLRQGEDGIAVKTDDRVDFASKYGRKATDVWYYSGLFNFRTQMAPGYDVPGPDQVEISNLLAPAYMLLALGMDYKPNDKFTAFISPLTAKVTIVQDDFLAAQGAFGVEAGEIGINDQGEATIVRPGETSRFELGGYVKLAYKTAIVENVTWQTKLDLFSNYANNPQNIDINWENLIAMKINKYLSATISTQLLYDDDVDVNRGNVTESIQQFNDDGTPQVDGSGNNVFEDVSRPNVGPGVQFKETLNIGLVYNF